MNTKNRWSRNELRENLIRMAIDRKIDDRRDLRDPAIRFCESSIGNPKKKPRRKDGKMKP